MPFYYYPWAVFYRKSVFERTATRSPTTGRVQDAGPDEEGRARPDRLGDKDGWPAMGTFDILNLRINGYDFHIA